MKLVVEGGNPLRGTVRVSPDKSITHRALLFSALAEGESVIHAQDMGQDNASTAACLRALGVVIEYDNKSLRVVGRGLRGLRSPAHDLDCGNSGSTMRMLAGVLAGGGVRARMVGDASLGKRPMGRICKPLRMLGADIAGVRAGEGEREVPPLTIGAGAFRGGTSVQHVASAQVKSALILAGLVSGCEVTVSEPALSRDHTERMLQSMGARLGRLDTPGSYGVTLWQTERLAPLDNVHIPGDFSSAAFWIAAGLLVEGSSIDLHDVLINPTRTGMLDILSSMGCVVDVHQNETRMGEPVASLHVESSQNFQNTQASHVSKDDIVVQGAMIPRLIDELVVLSGLFSLCGGRVVVREASELKVKESDRILETVQLLKAFGLHAEATGDGFVFEKKGVLKPAHLDVSLDHRLALTAAILAFAAKGTSVLEGFEVAAVSYPAFVSVATSLGARVRIES